MSTDASKFVTSIPRCKPMMNVGCLFDIPVGTYYVGKHGEHILAGGLPHIVGTCGRGNTYKSTKLHFFMLSTLDRYKSVQQGIVYDTENSMAPTRIDALAASFSNLAGVDLISEGRLIISDASMMGNKWWDAIKEYGKSVLAEKSKAQLETPFLDHYGNYIKVTRPTPVEIDSMSQMPFDSVELMQDKAEVGESGRNMEAMKASAAKSQMIGEMPRVTSELGLYVSMSAHLDDEIQMDPMAPPTKRLAFMKQKTIFKRVPKNFSFLTNTLYSCASTTLLQNRSDKTTMYPKGPDDRIVGDTDLQQITVQILRSKYGASGTTVEIIMSQSEGLLVGLSQLLYCKSRKYGIGGNDRTYFIELMPDVNLTRTTVRSVIDSNPALQRALEIQAELCQIRYMWKNQGSAIYIEPKDLYEQVKANGYDWDTILNHTRGYWVFVQDEKNEEKQFLSTMDIINMARSKDDPDYYHPYWWDKFKKQGK